MLKFSLRRLLPARLFGKPHKKQPPDAPIYLGEIRKLSDEDWQAALTKSPEEAARLVQAAETYGYLDAQLNWAQMLLDGYGTRRDPEAAFRWFGIAALSKRADALNMPARVLSAQGSDAGLVIESDDAIYILNENRWRNLISEPVYSVRSYPNSKRYKKLITMVTRERVELAAIV